MATVKIINRSGYGLPQYATELSAGVDVRSTNTIPCRLEPLQRQIFPTGLFVELPKGYELQVRPRSGLAAKYGITVLNAPGTIDADYRGEIGVILVNLSNEAVTINPGERIAQLVLSRYERMEFEETTELSVTQRGEGGFGSTGTK